jgi:hypothetical protein
MNRLKKLLNANNLKREAEPSKKEPGLIELLKDAHAALIRYKDKSTRLFKIYGRGEYDYGVSPNMDMQIFMTVSGLLLQDGNMS